MSTGKEGVDIGVDTRKEMQEEGHVGSAELEEKRGSREWLEYFLRNGWKLQYNKSQGRVRLWKTVGGKKLWVSVPKNSEAFQYALELLESAEKAREADVKRAEAMEKVRLDKRRPLIARELEDQAWFKNLIYELGKNAFNLLIKHSDLSEEELTYEGWEKARDKLVAKLREIYEFWESNPTLRELGYEYRRVLVERDAAVKVANDLRVALREALSMVQAAITLMPKDALEKFMMLTAMSDLARYVPRELDMVLSGGR